MNNEIKPKQLNSFAKVIQVDQNGNPIIEKKEEVKVEEVIKENKSDKKDLIIVIGYIVTILILLALIGLYLYLYVLPRFK